MTHSKLILSIATSLLVGAATGWAAGNSIEGNVIGPDGKPISGAEVRAEQNGGKPELTKTDAAGRFGFKNLRQGKYKLNLSAGKIAASIDDVRTGAGQVVRVHFDLRAQNNTAAGNKKVSALWSDEDRVGNTNMQSLRQMQANQPNSMGGH